MSSKRSAARKREWADPVVRARRSEALSEAAKRRYQDPEQRKQASKQMQAQLADPVKRKRLHDGIRRAKAKTRGQPQGALGRAGTKLYGVWCAMVQRCTNPNDLAYHNYGGRGIKVHPNWIGRGGFAKFFAHIGDRPSDKHTLDRTNNDGNYEPGNVRWATRKEQSHNSRKVRLIEINGESKPLAAWATIVGIAPPAFAYRVKNWPKERWLEPKNK